MFDSESINAICTDFEVLIGIITKGLPYNDPDVSLYFIKALNKRTHKNPITMMVYHRYNFFSTPSLINGWFQPDDMDPGYNSNELLYQFDLLFFELMINPKTKWRNQNGS